VANLWRALFGNDHPVEVEIGCGTGTFLVTAATRAPERNFFGIERSPRLAAATGAVLAAAGTRNARVLCADALCPIATIIPPASVSTYHLYFPDPWWKTRHHKRRVYSAAFVSSLARTLVPAGRVLVATDVTGLFGMLEETLTAAGLVRLTESVSPPETTFARRCLAAGRLIHAAAFTLLPSSGTGAPGVEWTGHRPS
jgi:tRNA (guanine-N7-)-methyltransferase